MDCHVSVSSQAGAQQGSFLKHYLELTDTEQRKQVMEQANHYVDVKGLSKHFGASKVFEDLSFAIEEGEFITLLGPSGCGKSTLLRCLAGLETPDEGSIFVNGEDITHVKPQKRGIGMVFQSYALFPNMTAAENIAFGLKMQGLAKSEILHRVAQAIRTVELTNNEKKYPNQLSGGQRQRVALARALVVKPRILLLDEPLSALDARIRRNLRDEIRSIQREMQLTTIFVTHDQEEAMTMSDRIFLMNKGQFVQTGTPEEVYLSPASEFAARFIGSYNLLSKEQASTIFDVQDKGLYAVRPESIYVQEEGGIYPGTCSSPVPGTVISHQLLGNVIRYRIAALGTELTVDVMNRSSSRLYAPQTAVRLLFNLAEIKPLVH